MSPPTCLRRVKRLRDAGLIERQIAILSPDRLAPVLGHGLRPWWKSRWTGRARNSWRPSRARGARDDAVQQCYRVSPGPGLRAGGPRRDMPGYLALAQRLFTGDANVRNVKAFFS